MEPSWMGLVSLYKSWKNWPPLSTQDHVKLQGKAESLQPRRGTSPGSDRASTLISDFQASELREINFYYLYAPQSMDFIIAVWH